MNYDIDSAVWNQCPRHRWIGENINNYLINDNRLGINPPRWGECIMIIVKYKIHLVGEKRGN